MNDLVSTYNQFPFDFCVKLRKYTKMIFLNTLFALYRINYFAGRQKRSNTEIIITA